MNRQFKVGLFVLFGIALMGFAVFLIGDNRRMWEAKVRYRGAFRDVAGLKPGAPVRMGGVDIGSVIAVGHGPDPRDSRIFVTMAIVKNEAERIREDTYAKVANKGLLGDKMMELSISDGEHIVQNPDVLLRTEEPRDMLANAEELAKNAQKIVQQLEPLAKQLGDPEFHEDIRGTADSLHKILDGLANKDSVAHRLLFDAEEAKKVDVALTNLSRASNDLQGIAGDVKQITERVKSGPGLAHSLVYDEKVAGSVDGVLAELHQDLRAIREGNGLAHSVIYGDDKSQRLMANLNTMSDDLVKIVANVREGKGTIGGLLVDPTIYEDLKSMVGNVERNQVLRALVRYSIKKDEAKPHVETPATPPPASSNTNPENKK